MSDTTYEIFQHYGTAAERAAFTPNPAAGIQPIYIWYETDTGDTYLYDTSWHQIAGSGVAANINISAGTTSQNLTNFVLSNSNNLSFGLNGSTITASANPNASLFAVSQTTQGTSGTQNLKSLSFAGAGLVSVGITNGSVLISVPDIPGGGLTNINLSAGTTSNNLSAVTFSNSNGVSFGLNGSTITASVGAAGINLSAGTTSGDISAVTFSNSHGISFGLNAGTVTASYNPLNFSAGTTSGNVTALTFSNSNNISFGLNAGTVTASFDALANINVSAGTTSNNLTAFTFNNANGISFGLNASTITASHDGLTTQTNQQLTLFATGNTTQSTTGTSNASSLIFRGDGIVSVGVSNGSIVISASSGAIGGGTINVSAGTTSNDMTNFVMSNANNVSFGLNGSTITASAAAGGGTLKTYYPWTMYAGVGTGTISLNSNTSGSMSLFPFVLPVAVAIEAFNIMFSVSAPAAGNNTYEQSGTFGWGIYTRPTGANSTRISAFQTGSFSYCLTQATSSVTYIFPTSTNSTGYDYGTTNSSGTNLNSRYTGLRQIGLFIGSTLTAGEYFLGMHHRNSSSGQNSGFRFSHYGQSHTYTAVGAMGSDPTLFSSGTAALLQVGGNWLPFAGSYSVAGLSTLDTDVTLSQGTYTCGLLPHARMDTRL